jgi:NitT/TauT family transport system substrate-binding protein
MRITHVIAAMLAVVLIAACTDNGAEDVTGRAVDAGAKGIKMGITPSPINGLVMVAKDEGFFEEEGLDVEFVEFSAGVYAMQAFLAGSLDATTSGEVPVVFAAMSGNNFSVITQIVEKTHGYDRIVALRDGNMTNPSDYFNSKKRTLAIFAGGGPEFYVYEFLKEYNVSSVELVNMNPRDMPAALSRGSVDAISVFEPYGFYAEKNLGNRAISFKDDEMYSEFFVLSVSEETISKHPEVADKLVRALVKASEFMEKNPEAAKDIVVKYSKMDKNAVDGTWGVYVFKPALNRKLIEAMNTEVEWAIATGKVKPESARPNFNAYIYTEALDRAMPGAVSL